MPHEYRIETSLGVYIYLCAFSRLECTIPSGVFKSKRSSFICAVQSQSESGLSSIQLSRLIDSTRTTLLPICH
ncbi:hypothetical protein FRX31_004314 [Thalictrum thalictroides]|uniref:Uncharacterized protein n=1 Tax=Thalictrum thalictroides TaxID=46969 RepID=A0A7J6X8H6_THATH|nr:hypothetical protein FRX31_004314 [Thalictrum thalictroides]